MEAVLGVNGVIIPDGIVREHLGNKYNSLIKKLTIRTKQRVGYDKVARMYKYESVDGRQALHLPRDVGRKLYEAGVISNIINTLPKGRKIDFIYDGEMFDNQKIVVDHLMDNVFTEENRRDGFATGVLNMQAGLGKTFTAAGLINRIGVNTLYIIPRAGQLKEQAKNDLKSNFPHANIGVPEGTKNAMNWADTCDIMIMVIDSVMKMEAEFFAKFGLIIIDEVHMCCSAQRATLFWKIHTECVLGMSATTGDRSDGFDPIYHKQLGDPIHADKLPNFAVDDADFKGHVRVISYFGPDAYTKPIINPNTGYLSFTDMIDQIIGDPYRNDLIADETVTLLLDPTVKHNVFVFSERREHLDVLEELIKKKLEERDEEANDVLFNPESFIMRGGTPEQELTKANTARIILTTYGYSSTGISIVRMDSSVYATPRKHGYKQICARCMRRGSDANIVRIFIDIVDSATGLAGQFYTRKNAYNHYGFEVAREHKVDKRG